MRSRQTAQSELYARALARLGCTAVHDAGYGDARILAQRMDALVLSGGGDIHPLYYGKHLTGMDTSVDQHMAVIRPHTDTIAAASAGNTT